MATPNKPDEDEYRQATKTVVDDAMRTDILGPNLVRVLEDHKPAHDLLHKIVNDCIKSDTDVKAELAQFIDEYSAKKKGGWIDKAIWIIVGALLTGIAAYIMSLFLQSPK